MREFNSIQIKKDFWASPTERSPTGNWQFLVEISGCIRNSLNTYFCGNGIIVGFRIALRPDTWTNSKMRLFWVDWLKTLPRDVELKKAELIHILWLSLLGGSCYCLMLCYSQNFVYQTTFDCRRFPIFMQIHLILQEGNHLLEAISLK